MHLLKDGTGSVGNRPCQSRLIQSGPSTGPRCRRLILMVNRYGQPVRNSKTYRREMEPAPELASLVGRMFRSWNAFDADAMVDAFSRHSGALAIGTDPGEWWEGFESISAMWRVQFRELQALGKVQFSSNIEGVAAWKEGTVGWVSGRIQTAVAGTAPFSVRLTFVAHEEGAYWRVVQWHASVPVTNEESFGVEITTAVDEILIMVHDEPPPVSALAVDGSVTIVFTDIEGSTALMELLGEPSWMGLLGWHDDVVKQQTTIFGGSVVKGQGDGFMLAFPASGSAAACAVAIQRALSTGWAGVHVPVRIGMHCGNARVEAGDFFGRTVVLAARVAGAAAGGEILVSREVQESFGGAFSLGAPRSLFLKGLAGHYVAYPMPWQ